MRQYLKNEVFKVSKWVELFISAIIMIAVIGGTIYLVKDVVQLMMNYPTSRDIYKFVGVAFNLVICIEFVKMLCCTVLSNTTITGFHYIRLKWENVLYQAECCLLAIFIAITKCHGI